MEALFIPSHSAARWLVGVIHTMLDAAGLQRDPALEGFLYVLIVTVVAVMAGWLIKRCILSVVRHIVGIRHTMLADDLLRSRVFTKCSHVIVPTVLLSLVPFALAYDSNLRSVITKILYVYAIMALAYAMSAVVDFVWVRYDRKENTRNLPLKGIANTMRGILWIIAFIIGVSALIDRSPAALLTGLGAFAAALLLIFKDSILGFVASIQLSQNDMVRIGDWIEVPDTPANGIVTDISLSTVKVRNFDNTIITCPPYMLVQHSFRNWRGMKESGARRIFYTLTIENSSIRFIDEAFIDDIIIKHPIIREWVAGLRQSHITVAYSSEQAAVNGSVETNLGLFRAYICHYLIGHTQVDKKQLMLVRLQPPTAEGTSLNIYAFVASTEWVMYESVLSELMEHVTAAAPAFGLRIYTPITGVAGQAANAMTPQSPG